MVNNIIHGNCVDILMKYPNKSFDMIITSPPYGDTRSYNGYDFNFEAIAKELTRTLKEGGVLVWVVGDTTKKGSETLIPQRQQIYFMDVCKLHCHDTMIYHKTNFSNPSHISHKRYHQIFEFMMVFSKGKPKTFNPICDKEVKYKQPLGKKTIRQKDGSMKLVEKKETKYSGMRTNVWLMKTAGQEMMCKSIKHPAKFPNALAYDMIKTFTNEGDIVLDPMCGGGTTPVQCVKLNRQYLAIDISEEYCKITSEEIEKELLKKND